jgi:hypothetical protein
MKRKPKVSPVVGWVLICPSNEPDTGRWHVCWTEYFDTKRSALAFANVNGWPGTYKAVRGELRVRPAR